MTSNVFVSLLHFTLMYLSTGELLQESNAVYTYGLPELTKDILEKIKVATGQPINTKHFYPILAASSHHYEVLEPQAFTKTAQYLKTTKNNKLEGGHYHANQGDKNSGAEKDKFYEISKRGKDGKELVHHKYGDLSGSQHKYNEERYFKKNHHESGKGSKGGKHKKGRKHGKFHLEKGFRDIYHKDEEKKSDYYWSNKHEEGKWIEYGFKNRKNQKKSDKGDEGKKEENKTEEGSYEKKEKKCTKCKT